MPMDAEFGKRVVAALDTLGPTMEQASKVHGMLPVIAAMTELLALSLSHEPSRQLILKRMLRESGARGRMAARLMGFNIPAQKQDRA